MGTSDPKILKEDNIGTLFPMYAEKQLASHNLTIDDIGIQFINQPYRYERWEDVPRPWQTGIISSDELAQSLEADQNPKLKDQLADIFDTIEVTVISDRENSGDANLNKHLGDPMIQTGAIRMANLHDRSLLLHHEIVPNSKPTQYKMILSLDSYDSSEGDTYSFYKGDHPNPSSDQLLRSRQEASVILDDRDNRILYHILYRHHQQSLNRAIDWNSQYPGISEITSVDDVRPLSKGDMASLALFYGRISSKMIDFQTQKLIRCEEVLKENLNSLENHNAVKGQFLSIVGASFY
jgi:hypothetical protein